MVVVGGGLAGLAAAAFAARSGAAVRVLERSGEPDTRARTREVQGFLIDERRLIRRIHAGAASRKLAAIR